MIPALAAMRGAGREQVLCHRSARQRQAQLAGAFKSPEQLAKDQHECIEAKRAHGFVGDAGMITSCVEQRGYTILTPKG
jgi:hypothetical protein